MKYLPIDTPGIIDLAAGWLAKKENYQWLDFGGAGQAVTPMLLKILAKSKTHFLRVYTSERDDNPIGIVALNGVDRTFRPARFGERRATSRSAVAVTERSPRPDS